MVRGLARRHRGSHPPQLVAMPSYYTDRLSAERLRACYDLAPPGTKAYLQAEIDFVLQKTSSSTAVIELGCGYGGVLRQLVSRARTVVGIDTSLRSLRMVAEFVSRSESLHLAAMDATHMGFRDRAFDLTICIQNGISAFGTDQRELLAEAARVTRPGGLVLFSSYSERFWAERLKWFEIQAEHGLIGEIDDRATGNGVIVCKDGFRATTMDAEAFRSLAAVLGLAPNIIEVDGSSLFCEIAVP
ncbi:MAG: class I SAM-dependent methyltransferase [Acidobacteriia bacterium]|nr:class I SAM-dependent methyltransferase [Terriglobia bacterium]